ncbi:MAG: universal stress protein [Gordonia sp. (in: high G+C Gram-positive bacteria)]
MTILAAISVGEHATAPLHLATQFARTTGERVIAVTVLDSAPPAGNDPLEAEYLAYLTTQTRRQLEPVVERARGECDISLVIHNAVSIPRGLTELAAEFSASLVVVGSSSSGLLGRITLGSVTERLVHTASVPVAFAPRGYCGGGRFTHLTVSYGGAARAERLVHTAAEYAVRWQVPMRVASFTVRPPMSYGGSIEATAEDLVIKQWAHRTDTTLRRHLAEVRNTVALPDVELALGAGIDWHEAVGAVGWTPGDLVILGSGAAGALTQVFLGSAAAKILRHVPAPAMVVPRNLT